MHVRLHLRLLIDSSAGVVAGAAAAVTFVVTVVDVFLQRGCASSVEADLPIESFCSRSARSTADGWFDTLLLGFHLPEEVRLLGSLSS